MTSSATTHILVFPYPTQGHILPLLDLTHHLLLRSNHALTFTIILTPDNLHILTPLLSFHPPSTLTPLLLPLPSFTPQNAQHLPPHTLLRILPSLRRLRLPILNWFSNHPSPPSAIISDMFLGWTHQFASQLGISSFIFSPSGALAVSLIFSLFQTLPPRNDTVYFPDLPGHPNFPWNQLSSLYRAYSSGDPAAEFLRSEWLYNESSSGLVVNTYADLEKPYLDHLAFNSAYNGNVWSVGPLIPVARDGSISTTEEEKEVLDWLDSCADAKEELLYVCFGSRAVLRNDQMEALATALERSGVRFLWKVKEGNEGFGRLPEGFEGRVAGRGIVVRGWAPQVQILRHSAVTAFLTHCGWNSVLEGVSAGTVMMAWPQGADQFFNTKLLVHWLKIGVRVGLQGDGLIPDPDELARDLARLMKEGYEEERLKVEEMKRKAEVVVSEGGSSTIGLDSLMDHLSKLPKPDANVIRKCRIEAEEEEAATAAAAAENEIDSS